MAAKLIAATCLLGLTLELPASAAGFDRVDTDKSRISFEFKQMGVPVDGSFGRFNAKLHFDPANPQSSHAKADIDLSSIDAGSEEANEEVKSKNWLHVQQFPNATFASTRVTALDANRFELAGRLTVKGKSRDIVVPIAFKADGEDALITGNFAFKRLDFGIGGGVWGDTDTVADEVQVSFRFAVTAVAPAKN